MSYISSGGSSSFIGTKTFNYEKVSTSPFIVTSDNEFLDIDTSSNELTIRFPATPPVGKYYMIKDGSGNALNKNITLTVASSTKTIDGALNKLIDTDYQSVSIVYDGANYLIF